jgi:hypothetical protein
MFSVPRKNYEKNEIDYLTPALPMRSLKRPVVRRPTAEPVLAMATKYGVMLGLTPCTGPLASMKLKTGWH